VTELANKLRAREDLTEKRLKALWTNLASEDARLAHAAMRVLAADPATSVPFLGDRVRPARVGPPPEELVLKWIADLDSDEVRVREAAADKLKRFGAGAKPALGKALAAKPTPEAERRIKELLLTMGQPVPPEELRDLRAVDVLEQSGTEEARRVLRSLAGGAETASLTRAAKRALRRLASQEKQSR
jgi:hypothetical protein